MTTAIQQKTAPGTLVCTVGRDGAKAAGKYASIYTGKVYKAVARKSDGVLTWRLIDTFGGTRSGSRGPSAKFVGELKESAEYTWADDIVAGQICE